MNITPEQAARIATNYILHTTSDTQVLKVLKHELNEYGVDIVRVRCINNLGKKTTKLVYIYTKNHAGEPLAETRIDGCDYFFGDRLTVEEYDAMALTNPVFGTIEEETAKENEAQRVAAEKQGEREFQHALVCLENDYKRAQQRHTIGQFEKSLYRMGTEKLENVLSFVSDAVQPLVQRALTYLAEKNQHKELVRSITNRTIRFAPVVEGILTQIEESIASFEQEVYDKVLACIKEDEQPNFSLRTPEQEAKQYVQDQKMRLIVAAVNHLQHLNIVSAENTYIRNQRNGFEGMWVLTLADGSTKTFSTNTIIAEGQIQRAHYRYLTNLK